MDRTHRAGRLVAGGWRRVGGGEGVVFSCVPKGSAYVVCTPVCMHHCGNAGYGFKIMVRLWLASSVSHM